MFRRTPPLRFPRPVALTSLLLLGLCAFAAIVLLREQSGTTAAIAENVVSRREASDLKESLIDLIGLLGNRVESVDVIHDRIEKHLDAIEKYADKPEERLLALRLSQSYSAYADLWKRIHEPGADRAEGLRDAAHLLETVILERCQNLIDYNSTQIEQSEQAHQRSLRRLAWVMAGVGITGGVAGLILGYGVARSLSRRIRRLQIGLQDAAGKLSPNLPAIILTGEGDLTGLEAQVQILMDRVEQVVQRLQAREREVLRADQLAAVGHLAAGVAHEIRNPLTSIKMLVQAGKEDPRGFIREDLEIIEQEINRMERSLRVFLDFARLPKPERSRQDMSALAARTIDLIRGRAAKQRVELRLSAPGDPVNVEADSELIQQVLVNLTLNALDAMPSGGTLEVIVAPAPDHVELSVLDTGTGISAEMMPRLFEPFVSTKDTGVGLGLVISRRIAEEHGGRLTVTNRPGGGASFTLWLPRTINVEPKMPCKLTAEKQHAEFVDHR
jgi:two-component system, NtrC family, sensor histidine kinase HydH